jgi:Uma2 family endonuclease
MGLQERLYTVDDLRKIAKLPENRDKWFELIRGVIYQKMAATELHNRIASRASSRVVIYADTHDLGLGYADGNSYVLTSEDEFIPDGSFVSKARLPNPIPQKYPFAPDLAIEVISPINTDNEISYKIEMYFKYGTRRAWVFYPKEKVVRVHRPSGDGGVRHHVVGIDGVLSGEDVVPGFTLPLSEIFR